MKVEMKTTVETFVFCLLVLASGYISNMATVQSKKQPQETQFELDSLIIVL